MIMGTRVEIILPDEVYRRAERLAQLVSRNVADVLTDTLMLALPSLSPQPELTQPITELADAEVLALIALQMMPAQDRRLSLLLERQQAGQLSDSEGHELLALMQVYQEGLLRKAQALHEAVRRGLREPLAS
jgi:hypothetical protein